MSVDVASYQCLGELIQDALIQFKTDIALVEMNRKRTSFEMTYLDFKNEALRVAGLLQASGVGAGDPVAIIMSNQGKWLLSAYAAFYRGAVLVPIDYKLSAEEQAALVAHSGAKVVVTEYPLWRRFKDLKAAHVFVSEAPDDADLAAAFRWETSDDSGIEPSYNPRQRDDLATIVYSSGTGGRPKGCMLTHECYLQQAKALMGLFPIGRGERYFSILPTNHAIDFMCGFIVPLASGATVVHQRTLRPEFILETMRRRKITHMALVPLVLEAFERAIRVKLEEASPTQKTAIDLLGQLNKNLTVRRPNPALSRILLKPIHDAFGGHLKLLFCGGAFVDRRRAEFFYRLGLPVVIGYGLTEACTVATVNDLKPFRADSVGRAVPGVEIRIHEPNAHGIGEVLIRGGTLMSGYLNEPELTAETIREGWLYTGDLGTMDASHHLHLVGRSKNMIVTEGGKNVYPEDIESVFEEIPCEELVVYAANYIWPKAELKGEKLVAVVRPSSDLPMAGLLPRIVEKNRKLPDFKRIGGVLDWSDAFPRTASMKVKRNQLVDELRAHADRSAVVAL